MSVSCSLSSLKGNNRAVVFLRDYVITTLINPSFFTQYGINPPRGVILYGSPGTGKTFLIRATANEVNANIIPISSTDFEDVNCDIDSILGNIFGLALKLQPSIIFMDEIDNLCPIFLTTNVSSSRNLFRRVCYTLYNMIDNLPNNSRIVLIGCTNNINGVDVNIRRSGRLDREFEIGVPNEEERKEMLEFIISNTNQNFHKNIHQNLTSMEINEISSKARGFVAADLNSLCQYAAMNAYNRYKKSFSSDNMESLNENLLPLLSSISLCMDDFVEAFHHVHPSALREVAVEVPNVLWEDIGGLL